MTNILSILETEEELKEYENFRKDLNNFCLNFNSYLKCIDCNGYSSHIICNSYESNNSLRELEYINKISEGEK
jgi:hypothetical protein